MAVFVQEQNVPAELELDDIDAAAVHVVAYAPTGHAVGTGRIFADPARPGVAKIGRMAVLPEARGTGCGAALLTRLLQVARKVERFNTPELRMLIEDMFDTMDHANGAGLAAPQIGVDLQVVIFGFDRNPRYPDAPMVPKTVLINPALEMLSDELEDGWEGCLSVPGLRGVVPRHVRLPAMQTLIGERQQHWHARLLLLVLLALLLVPLQPERMAVIAGVLFALSHAWLGAMLCRALLTFRRVSRAFAPG